MTTPASQPFAALSAAGSLPCALTIIDGTARLSALARSYLDRYVAGALAHLGALGEVRVRVVADPEMSAAHAEYLDASGTTDVITFDLSEPSGAPGPQLVLDVDILACLDEAARQGAARGHAPERELLLYIIHGVLHCLGHDDHDPVQSSAMHTREDEILRAIGVGDTFNTTASSTTPAVRGVRP